MIEYLSQTGSTNADLAARIRAAEATPEGTWLVADRQTDGRGRQGREWFDGAGNFMGSTLVHTRFNDPPPGTLALLAGLALHEVLARLLNSSPFGGGAERSEAVGAVGAVTIPPPTRLQRATSPKGGGLVLKWPNDLMIGPAKLAGILLEREWDAVIIGIGVNLASAPQLPDRQTIALSELGPTPDRNQFATDLARQFDLELSRWRDFGLDPTLNRWLAAAHPVGTPLNVGEPGETTLTGRFAGLSRDGALQLRLADGTEQVIHAGEVRFAD